jgi:hypothetical protein
MAKNEVSLGTFVSEKETAAFYRFSRTTEDDRVLTHYILKDQLAELGNPENIEVVIRSI